jgi:hypothetical protein
MHRKLLGTAAIAASLALVPVMVSAAPAAAAATCFGQQVTHWGTNGNDDIWGTPGDDVIMALAGDDRIWGLSGNDRICAGGGDDKVFGGPGVDRVWAGSGDDVVFGGGANDFLFGAKGNDKLVGGPGVDKVRQGAGWGPVKKAEIPRAVRASNAMIEAAGFRIKGYNTGGEFYLGIGDLGGGGNRVETNKNDIQNSGTFPVELSYNARSNAMTAKVGSAELTYDFDDRNDPTCAVEDWDIVSILVRENENSVKLQDPKLNGFDLGKDPVDNSGKSVWGGSAQSWNVMDVNFSTNWSLTGDLVTDGMTGNERTKLQVMVGCKDIEGRFPAR